MKKLTLSLAALMAISTFAGAQTNMIDENRFGYLGVGYSYMKASIDVLGLGTAEADGNAVTLIAGAKGNEYFAIEVRYSTTFGDLDGEDFDGTTGDIEGDMSNLAIYAKPMYSIDKLNLYGLIGYGQVTLSDDYFSDDDSESGFQWGLGASYDVSDNMNIFFDYTSLYDDAGGFGNPSVGNNIEIESFNFGITYRF